MLAVVLRGAKRQQHVILFPALADDALFFDAHIRDISVTMRIIYLTYRANLFLLRNNWTRFYTLNLCIIHFREKRFIYLSIYYLLNLLFMVILLSFQLSFDMYSKLKINSWRMQILSFWELCLFKFQFNATENCRKISSITYIIKYFQQLSRYVFQIFYNT